MSIALKKKMETLGGELKTIRQELKTWLDKKGPDNTIDVDAAGRDKVNELNAKCNELAPRFNQAREDWLLAEQNEAELKNLTGVDLPLGFHAGAKGTDGVGTTERGEVKSLGTQFVGSAGYLKFLKAKQAGEIDQTRVKTRLAGNIKTLFQRSAGWSPFVQRQPGFVPMGTQQPTVIDSIPLLNTDQSSIVWMVQTLRTNNAAPVNEAGLYPESAYALTETSVPVRKIAHFIPTTDEQIADVSGCRDFLDTQLELGCKESLEKQVIGGNGTAPNLKGFLNADGLLTQNQGADNVQDAVFKAMTKVQTEGFATATAIWMNPTNWQSIRLFKTTQGLYLWGNPDQSGPQQMWGLPVASTTFMPLDTALAGDFSRYSCLWMRAAVTVEVSNSHADYFIKGQLAIRAQLRAALTITRGAAFCKVGIGVA